MKWIDIQKRVKNVQGKTPQSEHCVKNAVQRVTAAGKKGVAKTNYKNCGRNKALTPEEAKKVVGFVKEWRKRAFCTCRHIRAELKLKVSLSTIVRTLNDHGYYWRAVPKKSPLTADQLKKRKAFIDMYIDKTSDWWVDNMDLVFDGVTLTKAPKSLSTRQKHAAQAIKAMWMKKGEAMDPDVHTFNRYGVQLGVKVPLWGGFSVHGGFALKLWTERSKMTKEEWATHVPALKRAASEANTRRKRRKMWLDNEGFLKIDSVYRRHGLTAIRFPPNSGDFNPIETVWARLRKDLALREFEDLKHEKIITTQQFKQRVAQLLHSYSLVGPGEQYSYLEKLVRGMPARLLKSKKNKGGPCGK